MRHSAGDRPFGGRRRTASFLRWAALLVAVTVLGACRGSAPSVASPGDPGDSDTAPGPAAVTETMRPDGPAVAGVSTIASRLRVPWGIAFFPGGDALVSERDEARLLRVTPGGAVSTLAQVPDVTPTSEGGLLGVAVSPDYERDGLIFVYATTAADNRVLSGTVADFETGTAQPVITGIPRGEIHDGGRLAFGPDGMLYVSTGETGNGDLAQDLSSLGGKILRIEASGAIPADNPFPGSPVWTYGHRNVQGITWDSKGRMWECEFGSQVWDEINLIVPGRNYGWPVAEGTADLPGMTNPRAVFSTDAASPSGLAFADGSLWMGALQGATAWRVPVGPDARLGQPVAVRLAAARTRTVVLAPDGRLWVTTSDRDGRGDPGPEADAILAITPNG